MVPLLLTQLQLTFAGGAPRRSRRKRASAGYPFALAVSLPGVGDRTTVRIERKAGKKWRKVATTQAIGERAEAVVTLGRGRHTLRAVAAAGGSRGLTAHVAMLCPSVTPGQFTTQIGTAKLRRIKIAPDGGFIGAATPDRATSILVRGKLHRGKVTQGRVQLSVGGCSGSQKFSARR